MRKIATWICDVSSIGPGAVQVDVLVSRPEDDDRPDAYTYQFGSGADYKSPPPPWSPLTLAIAMSGRHPEIDAKTVNRRHDLATAAEQYARGITSVGELAAEIEQIERRYR